MIALRSLRQIPPSRALSLLRASPCRPLQSQVVRLSSTVSGISPAPAPKRSWFFRLVAFTGTAFVSATVGFAMALPYDTIKEIRNPMSNEDSLKMFVPADADAQEKEDFINSMPLVQELRANPDYIESRPHLRLPTAWREQNLTAGTLMGPGKVTVPPYSWSQKDGKSYVQICHVGTDLCGHVGIVHGGYLATMLDEGLARCCFPVLPHHIGMTAKLEVNYKSPAMANQYLVLRGETVKSEGRKAWVDGHIETVPTKEGEEPVIIATATALYISPRQAAVRALLHPLVFSCGASDFVSKNFVTNVCGSVDDGKGVSGYEIGSRWRRRKKGTTRTGTLVPVDCCNKLAVLTAMMAACICAFSIAYSVVISSGDYMAPRVYNWD